MAFISLPIGKRLAEQEIVSKSIATRTVFLWASRLTSAEGFVAGFRASTLLLQTALYAWLKSIIKVRETCVTVAHRFGSGSQWVARVRVGPLFDQLLQSRVFSKVESVQRSELGWPHASGALQTVFNLVDLRLDQPVACKLHNVGALLRPNISLIQPEQFQLGLTKRLCLNDVAALCDGA